jgi:hypothetical protein
MEEWKHTKLEIDMCHRMMAHFDSLGIKYTWQLDCGNGITDFTLPDKKYIIECKEDAEMHRIMSALGQLLFYKLSPLFKGYHTYVASEPPATAFAQILKKYSVKIFDMSWDPPVAGTPPAHVYVNPTILRGEQNWNLKGKKL